MRYLSPDTRRKIYEPGRAPTPASMTKTRNAPRMTVGRATLLTLMRSYLSAVMDPFVTLLEIHKLMYFMQEAGEPLRLKYRKAHYGPYAENLRHVLHHIEGHFIEGFGDGAESPDKPIELKLDVLPRAERFLAENPETAARFRRVVELIEGFETAYGMELLATIHWVATREGAATVDEAREKAHAWNPRKRMFSEWQIQAAWDAISERGWLPPERLSRAHALA